jgi:RNA polymerase sigma-70 factor (ECF subfamily)
VSSLAAARISALRPLHRLSPDSSLADIDQESLSAASDEQLLVLIKANSQPALGFLFRRYARIAHGIGKRILRDSTEADDLVQDIFLYIHRKCGVYDPTKGSASSWIVQTIYYHALQRRIQLAARYRRSCATKENPGFGAFASSSPTEYERTLEGLVGRAKLREMMNCLTEDQSETLRLHFCEGHTLSEIAQMRGQSVGNVRHHFYRGIEKLRSRAFSSELPDRITSGTR